MNVLCVYVLASVSNRLFKYLNFETLSNVVWNRPNILSHCN